ncbi:hypothetical protein OC834_000770 [Tilletia horrida]|uniref:Uncharacterized protein n=1 Tax=Tilletia horrida TaxID=155126 RepID=A0AAN6GBC8_9BASI|nr:hypothetical protein OC842_004598 [Tilletia horrida]KAK0528821.1 hypothetical protein OC835_004528 [Tilletia horrida]KAK0537527.1 hypothetical protein OC834_000770 [Tilletia horrida]KAK0554375.1 hypothetical protein OC844_006180 [Tilletia horrida]
MSGQGEPQTCTDGVAFGPGSTCRLFDFTTLFENVILSILPSAVFLFLFLVARLPRLLKKAPVRGKGAVLPTATTRLNEKSASSNGSPTLAAASSEGTVSPEPDLHKAQEQLDVQLPTRKLDPLGMTRIALAVLLVLSALTKLILSQTEAKKTQLLQDALGDWSFTAAQALELVCSCVLLFAVALERQRTRGGHFLVPLFLLCSIFFEGARVRTFNTFPASLNFGSTATFGLFCVSLALRVLLLITESINDHDAADTTEGRATFMNRIGFFWLLPILSKGYKKPLTIQDLPEVNDRFEARYLGNKLRKVWDYTAQSNGQLPKTSLVLAVARAYPSVVFAPIIPRLAVTAATLAQPWLIQDTIAFIESYTGRNEPGAPPPLPAAQGWALAGAFALTYTVFATATAVYFWIVSQNGATLRGGIMQCLYDKSLRQHLGISTELGPGGAVNLMAADVERIIKSLDPIHELWSGLILVGIGIYMLYLKLKLVFLAPLIATLIFLFGTPYIGRTLGAKQKAWSGKIDERLAITSSFIGGIKAVKMGGLEKFFARKAIEARAAEIKMLRKYMSTLATVVTAANISGEAITIIAFAALAIVVHLDQNTSLRFDQETVFTAMAITTIISTPLLQIGQRFGLAVAAYASFKRIETFLLNPERNEDTSIETALLHDKVGDDAVHVNFSNASLSWKVDSEPVLSGLDLNLPPGITMVIGRLASGKSTLLQAVLGETYVTKGKVTTPAASRGGPCIAYASQDPWTQESLSIKDNIIFYSNEPFDPWWYARVIDACALKEDLDSFDGGDKRLAKSLSGGQKQRINLARAIYAREAALVVLDDPFSALDADTESKIWKNLFDKRKGVLRTKTVLLASNGLHRLRDVDWVVNLHEGTISEQGPPVLFRLTDGAFLEAREQNDRRRARLSAGNIGDLLATTGRDKKRASGIESMKRLSGISGISSMLPDADSIHVEDEAAGEEAATRKENEGIEQVSESKIGFKTYMVWVRAAGVFCVVLSIASFATAMAGTFGVQVYLQHWVLLSAEEQRRQFGQWMGGYWGVFAGYSFWYAFALFWTFCAVVPRAGVKLHAGLVNGILSAPLSFFNDLSTGSILNRFSQDLFIADDIWIIFFSNFIGNVFGLLGAVILMVIAAPYLLIIVAVLFAIIYTLRRFYIRSSTQLRRLEMASKSPLYTLFGDTTSGLAIIRAFGRTSSLRNLNIDYVNGAQRPYYTLYACRRWLMCWLNMCAMIANTSLVIVVVALRYSSSASLLGVALSQTVSLSNAMNQVVSAWCEAEIAAVVFERIAEFTNTPPEAKPEEAGKPLIERVPHAHAVAQHAHSGDVHFKDVVLSYTPGEGTPVLKGVSFSIRSGEHLGICGRSGSGKSTILLALLRMVQHQSGDIVVNGRPVGDYDLHELRSSITVVGQEPLIVNGATVRENIDLEGTATDEAIWKVLRDTQMAEFIKSLPEALDTKLDPKSVSLSTGRRQLLTIARAILNRKSIVVLDEVTSALDAETDAIVKDLMETELADSTIINIAHRLDAIRRMDRVLVLSHGSVLELDTPDNLLERPQGAFRSMAAQQGLV